MHVTAEGTGVTPGVMHLLPQWQQTVPSRHAQRSITLDTPSLTRAKNFQHKWEQQRATVVKALKEMDKIDQQFQTLILETAVDNQDRLKRNDIELAWLWHHLLNTCRDDEGNTGIHNEAVLKAVGMTADEIREKVFR